MHGLIILLMHRVIQQSNVQMNISEVFANVHEHFAKLRKLYFAIYHMYACITVVLCTILNHQ